MIDSHLWFAVDTREACIFNEDTVCLVGVDDYFLLVILSICAFARLHVFLWHYTGMHACIVHVFCAHLSQCLISSLFAMYFFASPLSAGLKVTQETESEMLRLVLSESFLPSFDVWQC